MDSGHLNLQGMQLFQKMLAQKDPSAENVLFSPYSLFCCLAMAASGAMGSTQQEILKLWGLENKNFEKKIHSLQNELSQLMGESLHQFSAAYLNDQMEIKSTYQNTISRFYKAALYPLDFSHPAAAANQINQHIEEHTCGMLKKVIFPEQISRVDCMILLDTLLFRGIWESPFNPEYTEDDLFYAAGAELTVPMMYQTGRFPYFTDAKHKIHGVLLPYKDNDCELAAIMPTADKIPLQSVIDVLADGGLDHWRESASTDTETKVYLPRINLKSSIGNLVSLLKTSGAVTAFTEQADFSGIIENIPFLISQIMQSVKIEIDECGTKAAAATTLCIPQGGPPMKIKYNVFRANRPFIVLIRNKKTDTILFVCAILDPSSKEEA